MDIVFAPGLGVTPWPGALPVRKASPQFPSCCDIQGGGAPLDKQNLMCRPCRDKRSEGQDPFARNQNDRRERVGDTWEYDGVRSRPEPKLQP